MKSGQPKRGIYQIIGLRDCLRLKTTIGNRKIVVLTSSNNSSRLSNISPKGRILDYNIRYFSAAAGNSSTVKSDAGKEISRLANICLENPNIIIKEKIYRLLYNPRLYEIAYDKLKSKPGNMTPGIVPTTLDGFSIEAIEELILELKSGQFQFRPGRRIHISKTDGKQRPITIAPPRDKIIQEIIRMILEAIFEPTFSDLNHGYRPNRSCHTALKVVKSQFGAVSWFIEGDVSKCFDSINHNILMKIIEDKILDRRFTRLIRKALNAGYYVFNRYHHSLVGIPQGSIISPILSNIYLDKLDKFIESLAKNFNIGTKPKLNSLYLHYRYKKKIAKNIEEKRYWHKLLISVPSRDPMCDNYKRLIYIRYADDWIIGVRGSKEDARQLLGKIENFLQTDLDLSLSREKTLITNSSYEKATFLGISFGKSHHRTYNKTYGYTARNKLNLRIEVPLLTIKNKLRKAGFLKGFVPCPKFIWLFNDKDVIINLYNSVLRGITNYYRFVDNYNNLASLLNYVLKSSCAKLLASKYSLKSQAKVYKKFGNSLTGSDKISFIQAKYGIKPWAFRVNSTDHIQALYTRSISAASLQNLICCKCRSDYRVEMHHIRKIKDLNPKLNWIDSTMAKRNRKQIPLCRECHLEYHGRTKSSTV